MKKLLLLAAAVLAGASVLTSCGDDDFNKPDPAVRVLTFEESVYESFIDTVQYGGPLLYSAEAYAWTDANTNLSSSCRKDDWSSWGLGYGWGNGIAISNYVDSTAIFYDKQLSVPVSNGSKNFAVVWDDGSKLSFADGKARVIYSMSVSPTTYCLANVLKHAGEGYLFKVIATGTKADGTTSTLDIVLAEGTDVKKEWFTVDLSNLGAVTSIEFTFDGTDKGDWGLLTPKYFALDNVTTKL